MEESNEIRKEIGNSNFSQAIELLVKKFEKENENYGSEMNKLKKDIESLKIKIKSLEISNKSLVREKNFHLIKQYSGKIVDAIENDEFDQFKKIIEEHDYPIDEYISDYPDLSHMNLLHFTIEIGKHKFAKYLIDNGADINKPDNHDKWTPLMLVIQKQEYNFVQSLLTKGADVNQKDIDGFTPLAVAVDTNNKELIKLLLKYKPQIDNAKEIVCMAESYENKEIIEILKDYFGFRVILYESPMDTEKNVKKSITSTKLKLCY